MRVLVTGGRDYADKATVRRVLEDYPYESTLIHGGARGADRLATEIAWGLGWDIIEHPADWKTHGKAAGFIRNQAMADAGADVCVVFPGGRGTADMERRARKSGIPVVVVE